MKISKVLIISVLTIAMPISQARAVVPNLNSMISDVVESSGNDLHISGADSHHTGLVQGVTLPQGLMKPNLVTSSAIIEQTPGVEELETQDQDQDQDQLDGLALPGHHFWTSKKFIITTTILLTTGLLVGLLLALSGGSSGSGSSTGESGGGSGAGSGSTGDNSLNLSNPPSGDTTPGGDLNNNLNENSLNNPPGGDGNPGGDNDNLTDTDPEDTSDINSIVGGGGGGNNSSNGDIDQIINNSDLPESGLPHHPEPSTLLLMGLGLLVPFLRKRSLQ